MKIKAIRTYQSVPFGGREVRHLSTQMSAGKKNKTIKMEEVKTVGIKVTSDKDAIIVPFANCACIILEDSKMVISHQGLPTSEI